MSNQAHKIVPGLFAMCSLNPRTGWFFDEDRWQYQLDTSFFVHPIGWYTSINNQRDPNMEFAIEANFFCHLVQQEGKITFEYDGYIPIEASNEIIYL